MMHSGQIMYGAIICLHVTQFALPLLMLLLLHAIFCAIFIHVQWYCLHYKYVISTQVADIPTNCCNTKMISEKAGSHWESNPVDLA